ncbi:MAG: phosphoethanolamine transferase [Acidaminococcaceae bacterium]|nr:phosphoethanolamine transferase [Acidaminococcaceae bacterium]
MKKIISFFITWLILTGLVFGYYVAVSNGLTATPFGLQLRRFTAMALVITIVIWLLRAYVPRLYWFGFGSIGVIWALAYPLPYWLCYHNSVPYFSTHHDIAFGGYFFISMCLIAYLLRLTTGITCAAFITSIIEWLALLPPIFQLLYLGYYGTVITNPAILAIWQTTPSEAKEYLLSAGGYSGVTALLIALIALLVILFLFNRQVLKQVLPCSKKSLVAMLIVALAAGSYTFTKGVRHIILVEMNMDVKQYFENTQEFAKYHDDNFAQLKITPSQPPFASPGTILIVIGESASRQFMSAYNNQYPVDTTPWLKEQKDSANFYLFDKVRACAGQTVPVLEKALTEKNLTNNLEFKNCVSIIDIAKKTGYRTYWFSNQSRMDETATPITLVAETADITKWTNIDSDSWQYDEQLLPLLKNVNPAQNNFVVLHLIGSHAAFENRFPTSFAKPAKTLIGNYEKSLQYTDNNLQKFYNYARNNLNLRAMLYFSDHGAVPKDVRQAEETRDAHFDIPFFIYLSDEYKAICPDSTEKLANRQHIAFTNDIVYDIVVEMLNVKKE